MKGAVSVNNTYDIIFCGLGASTCILVQEMSFHGLLKGKKVLVVDPSEKKTNDKTFCFWASEKDEIVQRFGSLSSAVWSRIAIDKNQPEEIEGLRYHHISSIKLYDSAKSILETLGADFIHEKVTSLEGGEVTSITVRNVKYEGHQIYDARPPEIPDNLPKDQNIYQSFVGLKVRLKENSIDKGSLTLMDFNVPQQGHTQFMYILPFSQNEALFELTRFGSEKITIDPASEIIEEYISKQFGDFEINEIEKGVIPMFMDLPTPLHQKNVISIGTRASKVKPSTGYAFKNMFAHAQSISAKKKSQKAPYRFRFYDQLLILILALWPSKGRPIFRRLFQARSTAYVLRFLDEKTSLWEDLKMFAKLPIGIFLKATLVLSWKKAKSQIMLFTPLVLFALISLFSNSAAIYVSYGVLLAGLFLVGIPHGAMDHMTESLSKSKRITFSFVVKYLGLMGIVYLLWLASPTVALVSFLLYSAWHFGETDIEEWGINSRLTGFIWGILFFIALFSSHIVELNQILGLLKVQGWSASLPNEFIFGLSLLSAGFLSFYHKTRSWLGLVLFLYLAQWIPLVIAFGVYFIFHHSHMGWGHLKKALGKNDWTLFKMSLPFNIGAFVLFAIAFLEFGSSIEANISIFFVFLSCISFPHIFCMHKFYELKRAEEKV